MQPINRKAVARGGLVAGIVLVLMEAVLMTFLQPTWIDLVRNMGGRPPSLFAAACYAVVLIVVGVVVVWFYAAIRPRYGPGPRTALRAGAAVWIMGWGAGFGSAAVLGIFPTGFVVIVLGWGLIECLLASVAGAIVYTERPPAGPLGD
jgi:hypothetical protein